MSQVVTFLGVSYVLPDSGDTDWGGSTTAFLVALANNSASGITLAAIGSSPNANGASISSTTLNLQPASGSFGGAVTTSAQTFAGVKTLSASPVLSKSSHVRATSASAQSIPNNTPTVILFGTEVYDTQGEYDPVAGTFTATEAGYYHIVSGSVLQADVPAAGDRYSINIYLNAALVAVGQVNIANAAVSQSLNSRVSSTLHLAAADVVTIVAGQVDAATSARLLIANAADNYLTIDRLY